MKKFDCVVVGAGMVGAASALALAGLGLTVALVEKHSPKSFEEDQAFDLRVSAISLSSEHLLKQLGAWPQLQSWRMAHYKRLGVWEHESSYIEFNADEISQSHLGSIVENRLIQLSLWQQVTNQENIEMLCPETLASYTEQDNKLILQLESETIEAKLLIAADGANSRVRQLANIGITGWDYQQSAMLINVETSLPQQDITWQQFYSTGPVALLPLPGKSELGGNASLVWYHSTAEIKRLTALSNNQLMQEIEKHFPEKLGKVKVLNKASFPLTRRHANHYHKGKVLLLGDAAHTINPMAGQGVNLGFKDVKALQTVIATAIGNGTAWNDLNVLKQYEQSRRQDNLLMMSTMDVLYKSFSHPSPLVKLTRNLALLGVKSAPLIKKKALAHACGI